MAVIQKTSTVTTDQAPFVASFSARGPQLISPNILKVRKKSNVESYVT